MKPLNKDYFQNLIYEVISKLGRCAYKSRHGNDPRLAAMNTEQQKPSILTRGPLEPQLKFVLVRFY